MLVPLIPANENAFNACGNLGGRARLTSQDTSYLSYISEQHTYTMVIPSVTTPSDGSARSHPGQSLVTFAPRHQPSEAQPASNLKPKLSYSAIDR